jgi:hypothetical protein
MNRIATTATLAIAALFAGAAQAEGPLDYPPTAPFKSQTTRAAVVAELLAQRPLAAALASEAGAASLVPTAGVRTRAEVRAEVRRSIASGEYETLASESSVALRPQSAGETALRVARTAR